MTAAGDLVDVVVRTDATGPVARYAGTTVGRYPRGEAEAVLRATPNGAHLDLRPVTVRKERDGGITVISGPRSRADVDRLVADLEAEVAAVPTPLVPWAVTR